VFAAWCLQLLLLLRCHRFLDIRLLCLRGACILVCVCERLLLRLSHLVSLSMLAIAFIFSSCVVLAFSLLYFESGHLVSLSMFAICLHLLFLRGACILSFVFRDRLLLRLSHLVSLSMMAIAFIFLVIERSSHCVIAFFNKARWS
jgi:hypothetical protein